MMKLLKVSAIAALFAITGFSAEAKDHTKKAGFNCNQCTEAACGKTAKVDFLKACADCPGAEVFDCGTASFDANNCQKKKGSQFDKSCSAAAKMMSKASFQAHLMAKEGNPNAQAIIDGFKALDAGDHAEAKDTTE